MLEVSVEQVALRPRRLAALRSAQLPLSLPRSQQTEDVCQIAAFRVRTGKRKLVIVTALGGSAGVALCHTARGCLLQFFSGFDCSSNEWLYLLTFRELLPRRTGIKDYFKSLTTGEQRRVYGVYCTSYCYCSVYSAVEL